MIQAKKPARDDEGFWKTLFGRKHNVVLLAVGIAILAIVAIVSEASGGESISALLGGSLKMVTTEFGFALLIAAILSASFEENTRHRFHAEIDKRITEIQQNVFRSTYGRQLPEEFANEIEELLFRSKFVHASYRVQYDFNLRDGDRSRGNNTLDVKIEHRFTVRNLTASAAAHHIQLHVQDAPYGEDVSHCAIESVVVYGSETFTDEQLEHINSAAVHCGGFREFNIDTKELLPGKNVDVVIAVRTTNCVPGFTFTRCSRPTNGLTVVARFPSSMKPLRVCADAAHRSDCKLIGAVGNGCEYTWVIEDAVLPYQGINFWWHTREKVLLEASVDDE